MTENKWNAGHRQAALRLDLGFGDLSHLTNATSYDAMTAVYAGILWPLNGQMGQSRGFAEAFSTGVVTGARLLIENHIRAELWSPPPPDSRREAMLQTLFSSLAEDLGEGLLEKE